MRKHRGDAAAPAGQLGKLYGQLHALRRGHLGVQNLLFTAHDLLEQDAAHPLQQADHPAGQRGVEHGAHAEDRLEQRRAAVFEAVHDRHRRADEEVERVRVDVVVLAVEQRHLEVGDLPAV